MIETPRLRLRRPPDADGRRLELACRLVRWVWGDAIATEAAQRVLDKLGFTRQGERDYKGARAAYYLRVR